MLEFGVSQPSSDDIRGGRGRPRLSRSAVVGGATKSHPFRSERAVRCVNMPTTGRRGDVKVRSAKRSAVRLGGGRASRAPAIPAARVVFCRPAAGEACRPGGGSGAAAERKPHKCRWAGGRRGSRGGGGAQGRARLTWPGPEPPRRAGTRRPRPGRARRRRRAPTGRCAAT